jgi:hypothetical protein
LARDDNLLSGNVTPPWRHGYSTFTPVYSIIFFQ